jgi:hypothetical protein
MDFLIKSSTINLNSALIVQYKFSQDRFLSQYLITGTIRRVLINSLLGNSLHR